jgi:Response regulator receiver domain
VTPAAAGNAEVTRLFELRSEPARDLARQAAAVAAACHAMAVRFHRVIRVLLAEDAAVVRHTMAALLGLEPDIEVIAALESGDQIVPVAVAHRPDIALLDIALPGSSGLAAAAELAKTVPGCRVLIVTGLESPRPPPWPGHNSAAQRSGPSMTRPPRPPRCRSRPPPRCVPPWPSRYRCWPRAPRWRGMSADHGRPSSHRTAD